MKRTILVVAAVLVMAFLISSCATDPSTVSPGTKWINDYQVALAQSRETQRPILMNFTGSNWCIWCKKLSAEVFRTKKFREWAAENVILLEVDFPYESYQPKWLKEQNEKLKTSYGIKGFPTILFVNGDAQVIGRSGYMEGGATPWISHASSMIR